MTPPKFPKIYHLPFSQEIKDNDKVYPNPDFLLEQDLIILEKLDGGNTCIYNGNVYARSTSSIAKHPSFDYIKNVHVPKTLSGFQDYYIYGENMYAIHSIEYSYLDDYFYVFAVYDGEKWLEWDMIKTICHEIGLSHAPCFSQGKFKSWNDILRITMKNEKTPKSFFNDNGEGFVVRYSGSFNILENYTAKFVRKNHVQSDEHWNKNWHKAKLNL